MSLNDFIEKLRSKPEVERRRILVGTTFSITALIFFIWLSVVFYNGGDTNVAITDNSAEHGPISEISNTLVKFTDSLEKGVNSIKSIFIATSSNEISTTSGEENEGENQVQIENQDNN